MRVNVINKLWILSIVTALCVGAGLSQPASVEALSVGPPNGGGTVSEAWDGSQVSFTINALDGGVIYEFAVGNNDATGAWTDVVSFGEWAGQSLWEEYGWYGTIANKNSDGIWSSREGESLPWLNVDDESNGFGDYSTAFLYTMWVAGYGGYYAGYALPEGMTDGFYGTTELPESPYAIYDGAFDVVYYGNTGGTPIPEPASLPLLLAGIAGLIWLKRRFIVE